jgi:APA family basic amino acid/polyamine antiporter
VKYSLRWSVQTEFRQLSRRLGWPDAAAIIVSNVIGGGILFTPPQVAAAVGNPWWFLAAWLAGGALAFAGAMAYAELAVLRPRAGGEYVYLTAAYGRIAGFLTGWTSFVAGFSGAVAVSAVVFASYLGRFLPFAGDATPLAVVDLRVVVLTISRQSIAALALIALTSAIHIRGVGPGRLVGNVLATLKVSALVAFIVVGLAAGDRSLAHLGASETHAPVQATAWLLALVPVMFTYSGWNAAAYVAEEVRNPERSLPLALGIGTLVVAAIYLGLNLLYLAAFPIADLARVSGSVLDVIADRLLGSWAGNVMGVVSLISLAASVSAMTFAGPRVYFAMARDGLFFPAAARVSRYQTPATSIVAQALWSSVLVLSGTADALTRYTGFAVVLFAGIAVAALFVLRRREPAAPRLFRALGYPALPAAFTVVSALIVVNAVIRDPGPSAAGLLVIAAGLPLYLWFARRGRRTGSDRGQTPV